MGNGVLRRKLDQGGVLDFVEYLFLAERAHTAYLLAPGSVWHDATPVCDNLKAFAAVLANMDHRHRRDLYEGYFLGNLSCGSQDSLDAAVAKTLARYESESWTSCNPEMLSRNLEVVLHQIYTVDDPADHLRIAGALAPYGESLFVLAVRGWWRRQHTAYARVTDDVASPDNDRPGASWWARSWRERDCFLNLSVHRGQETASWGITLDSDRNAIILTLAHPDFEDLRACLENHGHDSRQTVFWRPNQSGDCRILETMSPAKKEEKPYILTISNIQIFLEPNQIESLRALVRQYRTDPDPEVSDVRRILRFSYGVQ